MILRQIVKYHIVNFQVDNVKSPGSTLSNSKSILSTLQKVKNEQDKNYL